MVFLFEVCQYKIFYSFHVTKKMYCCSRVIEDFKYWRSSVLISHGNKNKQEVDNFFIELENRTRLPWNNNVIIKWFLRLRKYLTLQSTRFHQQTRLEGDVIILKIAAFKSVLVEFNLDKASSCASEDKRLWSTFWNAQSFLRKTIMQMTTISRQFQCLNITIISLSRVATRTLDF